MTMFQPAIAHQKPQQRGSSLRSFPCTQHGRARTMSTACLLSGMVFLLLTSSVNARPHHPRQENSLLFSEAVLPHNGKQQISITRTATATTGLASKSRQYSLLQLRGGSSPWPKQPAPMNPRRGTTTQQSSPINYQQQQQQPEVITVQEDGEDAKEMIDAFLTRDSRNSFIARVYAILSVQLAVTAASCTLFGLHPSLGLALRRGEGAVAAIPAVGLLMSTIAWFWISMSPEARRKAPMKWNLLAAFTIGESLAVGFITSFYKFQSVVSAMGATALASVTVSAYTILQRNPNRDLSQWGAGLSSCAMIFIVYGLIGLAQQVGWLPAGFLPYNDMIYSGLGACLFSFFLAYHTKLIVGGKHAKYQMNEQDYVFGAMALYNDIINIFLYILRVIGEDKD